MAGDVLIGAGSELAANGIDGQRVTWGQVGIAAGAGALMGLVFNGAGMIGSKLRGTSNRPFGGLMLTWDATSGTGNMVNPVPTLETLPTEVFHQIASHLDGASLQNVALSSRRMRDLVHESEAITEAAMYRETINGNTLAVRQSTGETLNIAPRRLRYMGYLQRHLTPEVHNMLRWMQDTVMGRTPYRAGWILNRGLPIPSAAGNIFEQRPVLRFHPSALHIPENVPGLRPQTEFNDYFTRFYPNEQVPYEPQGVVFALRKNTHPQPDNW